MESKKIVASCPAGLGNRIKCLVSTIKHCDEDIGKGIDAQAHVYWPLNKECGCKFEELFSPPTPLAKLHKGEVEALLVDAYHSHAEIKKSWKFELPSTDKSDANAELDFKYHRLKKSEINEFLPYFGFIQPKKDIEDTVWAFMNKYKESFDKGEVIGVHIRKGDFPGLYDGRGDVSQEDNFIERMTCLLEVNPHYKFLLCTEDKETEEKFIEVFGEKTILIFPKRYRSRNEPNAIKEALVDILLLSKCPIIIGTFLSTFTEIAWWLGGCKANVTIPGTEDREAVAKVLAKLPQKGEGIHKKIWRRLMIWWKEGI